VSWYSHRVSSLFRSRNASLNTGAGMDMSTIQRSDPPATSQLHILGSHPGVRVWQKQTEWCDRLSRTISRPLTARHGTRHRTALLMERRCVFLEVRNWVSINITQRRWFLQVCCHYESSLWTGNNQSYPFLIPLPLRKDVIVRITSSCLTGASYIWPWADTGLDALSTRVDWECRPQCNQYQYQC